MACFTPHKNNHLLSGMILQAVTFSGHHWSWQRICWPFPLFNKIRIVRWWVVALIGTLFPWWLLRINGYTTWQLVTAHYIVVILMYIYISLRILIPQVSGDFEDTLHWRVQWFLLYCIVYTYTYIYILIYILIYIYLHVYASGVVHNPPSSFFPYPDCGKYLGKAIWVFPKIVVPENGWFIMENPINMDDLGGFSPYFWFNTHITQLCLHAYIFNIFLDVN